MHQAIAGVTPACERETTVMTVWPSIAAYPSGRALGGLYQIDFGFYIFTVGNLLALASIPHAIALYFWRLAPWVGSCYRITNRRIVVERGLSRQEDKSVDLDRFDEIVIQVQPGQEWFQSGDLIFQLGDTETFRLEGVSRPESFRQACLKAHAGYVGVKQALEASAAPAG